MKYLKRFPFRWSDGSQHRGPAGNRSSRFHRYADVKTALISSQRGVVLARKGGDDGVDGLLHFLIGERAIRRTEHEAHRQAHAALRHARSLVSIELANGDERRRRGGTDSAANAFSRQALVY